MAALASYFVFLHFVYVFLRVDGHDVMTVNIYPSGFFCLWFWLDGGSVVHGLLRGHSAFTYLGLNSLDPGERRKEK